MKPGIRQANNFAWRRLNAPSAARGMKAPHSSKRPTLTGGPFCVDAPSGLAYQRRTTLPRQPQWWHCEIPSCVSPFGPSLRNVQKRSQRFCARPILGARPDGTCLRQSKKAPSVFVCRPSLACIINNNPIVIHPNNLKVIHSSVLSPCFIAL